MGSPAENFITRTHLTLILLLILAGCRHPLVIVGEGDIRDISGSGYGCTLEQYRASHPSCYENNVTGEYSVTYKAVPRPGWRFVEWNGPCPNNSPANTCTFDISSDAVTSWDRQHGALQMPATVAVFTPIAEREIDVRVRVAKIFERDVVDLSRRYNTTLPRNNQWRIFRNFANSKLHSIDFESIPGFEDHLYLVTVEALPPANAENGRVGYPSIHGIIPGERLRSGDYRLSILTDAIFHYGEFPPLQSESRDYLDVASRLTVKDVNLDGTVDYSDVLGWNWEQHIDLCHGETGHLYALINKIFQERNLLTSAVEIFAVAEATDTPMRRAVFNGGKFNRYDYTLNPMPDSVLLSLDNFSLSIIDTPEFVGQARGYYGVGDADGDGYEELYISDWDFDACAEGNLATVPKKMPLLLLEANENSTDYIPASTLFGRSTTDGTSFIRVADFDLDNQPDVLITPYNECPFTAELISKLYYNNGTTFDETEIRPSLDNHEGYLGDFNFDGYPDFIVHAGTKKNDFAPNGPRLFINNQNRGFDSYLFGYVEPSEDIPLLQRGETISVGWASAFANFDKDPESEVVIVDRGTIENSKHVTGNVLIDNIGFEEKLAYGDVIPLPRSFFEQHSEFQVNLDTFWLLRAPGHEFQTDVFDFDNDGDNDILINSSIWANPPDSAAMLQFLENDGRGNFKDVTENVLFNYYIGKSSGSWDPRIVDVNGDGFLDIMQSVPPGSSVTVPYQWSSGAGEILQTYQDNWANEILINTGNGKFVSTFWKGFHELTLAKAEPLETLGSEAEPYDLLDHLYFIYKLPDGRIGFITNSVSNSGVIFFDVRASQRIGTGPKGIDPATRGAPGFNEYYYLTENPDVLKMVQDGAYPDGLSHYLDVGKSERRRAYAKGAIVP